MNIKDKLARIQAGIERAENEKNKGVQADSRHELNENTVTKSNALCRAYYRFDIIEKRAMEAIISQLDPRLFNTFQTQDIELSAKDYAKTFNVSQKHAYEHLAQAVDKLLRRVITVRDGLKVIKRPLMFKAEYTEGEGKISATFHPELIEHLIGLRKKFTSYPLIEAANFKSSYTWRFFELMMSWSQDRKHTNGLLAGWFTIEVGEFRKMLGIPDSYQLTHIKERVIERAQAEFRESSNIILVYKQIKKGRSVTHFKFEFLEDDQRQLF
jgi:plasmid replication initiation protein